MVLTAFHGKQEVKNFYTARVENHRMLDEIAQGAYYIQENGKTRACAVGCVLHSDDHDAYETELGIPVQLAFLQDVIFEGLPDGAYQKFPGEFLNAVPVGADLSKVTARFLVWLLVNEQDGVIRFADTDNVKVVIQNVANLHQRRIDNDPPTSTEWAAASAAASEAASAAAWAAASEAARAPAWAAARAAASAAASEAASAAAWAAASEAARAPAWAAARAARETAWERMAAKLLQLLREANRR